MPQRNSIGFRWISMVTLTCFIVLMAQGCVSIKVKEQPLTGVKEKPSISLKVYLKKPDKGQEDYVFSGVSSTLSVQDEKGEFVEIAHSEKGSWILKNAPAGTYRITLGDTITVNGKSESLKGDRSETFTLPSDQRAELTVQLKRTPVGFIVVISVVVVALIIWLIARNADNLPDVSRLFIPPLPKPGSNIPLPRAVPLGHIGLPVPSGVYIGPQPLFYDGGYYIASDERSGEGVDEKELPPEAVSFYPQMNETNVPRDTTIWVFFSSEMDESSLIDERVLRVIGTSSDIIKGSVRYDAQNKKLEFIPEAHFQPSETVTVTLMGKLVRNVYGSVLAADYEWSFSVSPDNPSGLNVERVERR
ncbi:Ig-like domain-containing protein [bacterium]|nr:Ig-like domain-containing protein [bacterium]